jgi:enoyl-CoA hydratase/carnithine racemase
MSDRVVISREGGIAHVRLNRPDKLNALDYDMFVGLAEAGKSLMDDKSVRAVVLSGEGRAFCAGLDVSGMFALGQQGADLFGEDPDSPANRAQRACWIWRELPMPVIAAVHGYAFGGGLQVALGADIRIISRDCRLSVMEIKWGLIPDMTGTQSLRNLVRLDIAKELVFTGRIVGAEEAIRIGLATEIAEEPIKHGLAIAQEIAQRSPTAIRAGKKLMNASVELSVADGLALEADLQKSLIGSANQMEAIRANMAKETPNFEDPK